jgi:hypothetical protein
MLKCGMGNCSSSPAVATAGDDEATYAHTTHHSLCDYVLDQRPTWTRL